MEINSSFPLTNDEIFIQKVIKNSVSNFTLKHILFYKFLRPFLSAKMRQFLSRGYHIGFNYKNNFIEDEFVNLLKDDLMYNEEIMRLYPFSAMCAIVLTHDVETSKGFSFIPKVIELEEKYGVKSSWNIVPYKYKTDPGIIRLIREAGHEIGIHGYNHDGKLFLSKDIFDKRVPLINKALEFYGAIGFRSPMVHRNLEWQQQLNILYDSSCFDYDPFQPFPDPLGIIWPFKVGKFIELPYTLLQDHSLFLVLKQKDIKYWIEKSNWLKDNHGVILTLTHPDYLYENNLVEHYEELLKHLNGISNAWRCLPRQLAEYWNGKKNLQEKQQAFISENDVYSIFRNRKYNRQEKIKIFLRNIFHYDLKMDWFLSKIFR